MATKKKNKKKVTKRKKQDKKELKSLLFMILIVLVIIVVTIAASYAYFTLTAGNNSGTTIIRSTIGSYGNVSLVGPSNNLHITVNSKDMKDTKKGTTYYATNNVNKNFDTESIPREVVTATVIGGEDSVTYEACRFNLNVSLSGNMKELLQTGDATLTFSGAYTETSDLTTIKNTREIKLTNLSGTNREQTINVVVTFNNLDKDQNYLIDKTLNIQITSTDLSCEPTGGEYIMAKGNSGGLTDSVVGDMVRFQGTGNNVNNFICFATSDKDTCTSNEGTYMYRIIGITDEGLIKVIKKTSIGNMRFTSDPYASPVWNSSSIFRSINGSSFLTNKTYVPDDWLDKIVTMDWKYGNGASDVHNGYSYYNTYNNYTSKVSAKIGLIYPHEFLLAYPGGNPGNKVNAQKAWVYFSYNQSGLTSEWTMIRAASDSRLWLTVLSNGASIIQDANPTNYKAVRPTFYIDSNISLKGTGSITDPYIITN